MPRHKDVVFVGSSLKDLKSFPLDARRAAGFQLDLLQQGEQPFDCKPMKTIGRASMRSGFSTSQERFGCFMWSTGLKPFTCCMRCAKPHKKPKRGISNWLAPDCRS